MDRGPIRPSRTSGGGMINSRPDNEPPTPIRRDEEPKAPLKVEEPVHHRASTIHEAIAHDKKPRKKKRLIILIVAIIVVIGLVVGGWFYWENAQNAKTDINTKEYQAVFLTNGQNYFGKLAAFNSKYMKLTNVYYLESGSTTDASQTSDSTNYKLVKLGNELHGPEDEMLIAKDQILFYENLKSTGKVSQLIAQDQKN